MTVVLLVGALVTAVFAAGAFASGHSADPQDSAYLRVVHASPDAPAVDVFVDNQTLATNVSFGEASDYALASSGDHTVRITRANDTAAVVFEGTVTLERQTVTTLAASGEVTAGGGAEFALRRFVDDAAEPDDDEAAVRIAHLSPDAPTVDVTAEGGTVVLAENVSFGNASAYATVPDGDYTVEIREDTPTADGPVIATAEVSLEGGQAHTAWALGYVMPGPAPVDRPFEVGMTEDATVSIEVPGEAEVVTGTPTATGTATATTTGTETATGAAAATPTETP